MRSRRHLIVGSVVAALVLAAWVCARPTSAAPPQDPLASFDGSYAGPYNGSTPGILYVTADGAGTLTQLAFVSLSPAGPSFTGNGGTYQVNTTGNPPVIVATANAPNSNLSFIGILSDRGLRLQYSSGTVMGILEKQ
jgi:hypothetical protein